jgi:molybdate transport system ATP-binding protein
MIHLRNIHIAFPNFALVVEDHQISKNITGIFGPSGSGKTTLLEVIAGIRRPETGWIGVNGVVFTDTTRKIHLPIERRAIGYVPQDLALFPHLDVQQNLLFGTRGRSVHTELRRIVELLEIDALLSRRIVHLSGGEKQRVAFARAMLASPSLLMLDEPLASLDGNLKIRIIEYLLSLFEEFKIPMLFVSHDREEILQLCNDVLVLQHGGIVKRGAPSEIL